jgi:hypothetical protein
LPKQGQPSFPLLFANYVPHRYILQQSVWVQMRQVRPWSLREGINLKAKPTGTDCVDCLATGGWWLHLRLNPNNNLDSMEEWDNLWKWNLNW